MSEKIVDNKVTVKTGVMPVGCGNFQMASKRNKDVRVEWLNFFPNDEFWGKYFIGLENFAPWSSVCEVHENIFQQLQLC